MPDKFKIILLIITVIIAIFLSFFIGLIVGQKIVQKEKGLPITKIEKSLKSGETPKKNAVETTTNTKSSKVASNTQDDEAESKAKVSTVKEKNAEASPEGVNRKDNPETEALAPQNQPEANTIGKLLSARKNVLQNKSKATSADDNEFAFQPVTLHGLSIPISKASPTYTISTLEPVDQYLAQQQVNKLSGLGFAAYNVRILNRSSSLFLTRIGQYETRKDAEVAVRSLPNIYRGNLTIFRVSKQTDKTSNTPSKKDGS